MTSIPGGGGDDTMDWTNTAYAGEMNLVSASRFQSPGAVAAAFHEFTNIGDDPESPNVDVSNEQHHPNPPAFPSAQSINASTNVSLVDQSGHGPDTSGSSGLVLGQSSVPEPDQSAMSHANQVSTIDPSAMSYTDQPAFSHPVQPVMTDPTASSVMIDPTALLAMINPTDSSGIFHPTESSGMINPTDSSGMINPTDSSGTINPTDSSVMVDPTSSSVNPSQPAVSNAPESSLKPSANMQQQFPSSNDKKPSSPMMNYTHAINGRRNCAPSAIHLNNHRTIPRYTHDTLGSKSAASSPSLTRDFQHQLSLRGQAQATGAPDGLLPSAIDQAGFPADGTAHHAPLANGMDLGLPLQTRSSSQKSDATVTEGQWSSSHSTNWSADMRAAQSSSSGDAVWTPPSPGGGPRNPSGSPPIRLVVHRSKLHIAPIAAKSRVETQINVTMTLEDPPPGLEHLHLALHTIAKSKLLTRDEPDRSRALELHTMLVSTSAMHEPEARNRALARAAAQQNETIQRRAETERESGGGGDDENKNETRYQSTEADKPAHGGEVRICTNCINRERKRAGRKKLKREEEQQHWERHETERVVVFNSNEYLPFKPFDATQHPFQDSRPYHPPPGAVSVAAAMRIACYCRHHGEKEGFRVIFTLKDQHGEVVAQEMSESILITDDHKDNKNQGPAPSSSCLPGGPAFSHSTTFGPQGPYSTAGLTRHPAPFASSHSADRLADFPHAAPQFLPHSHVHQLPLQQQQQQQGQYQQQPQCPDFSRPASPTAADNPGPKKKRKSSSCNHRRVPSALQMTPRAVDSSHAPMSAGLPCTAEPAFSPAMSSFAASAFPQQQRPHHVPAQSAPQSPAHAPLLGFAPSHPHPHRQQQQQQHHHQQQLPNHRQQYHQPYPQQLPQQQQLRSHHRRNHPLSSAYFSHPSSAVPSRSNSPVQMAMMYARPLLPTQGTADRVDEACHAPPMGDAANLLPMGDGSHAVPTANNSHIPLMQDGSHVLPMSNGMGDGSHAVPTANNSHIPLMQDGSHVLPMSNGMGDGSHAVPTANNSHIPLMQDGSHVLPMSNGVSAPPTHGIDCTAPPQHASGHAHPQDFATMAPCHNAPPPQGPVITKLVPPHGPLAGGTEVALFGQNLPHDARVAFDTQMVPAQWYSPCTLLATTPPGRVAGDVAVRVMAPPTDVAAPAVDAGAASAPPPLAPNETFRYVEPEDAAMDAALGFPSAAEHLPPAPHAPGPDGEPPAFDDGAGGLEVAEYELDPAWRQMIAELAARSLGAELGMPMGAEMGMPMGGP